VSANAPVTEDRLFEIESRKATPTTEDVEVLLAEVERLQRLVAHVENKKAYNTRRAARGFGVVSASLMAITDDRRPYTDEVRDAAIHLISEKIQSVQDPAGGTVILSLAKDPLQQINVQLWIHEWE
jgi:uncharacterized membrane-anchored protein